MSTNRHVLWGAIVGACVAIAFNVLLTIQFDVEGMVDFLIMSLPACTALGAIFGWAWWKILGR
jgi:hypothetical protein